MIGPLTVLLLLPLLGAVAAYLVGRVNLRAAKLLTILVCFLTFLQSVAVYMDYRVRPKAWFPAEDFLWVKDLGISYTLGVDGISLPLVMLTTLLMTVAVISSYEYIHFREREYYPLLLILQMGVTGVFMALDLFLFYVFWELVLIPMFFLIGIWGGPRREYSAVKFFIYTHIGSLAMLLGILAIYLKSIPTGVTTFNMLTLAKVIATRPEIFYPGLQQLIFVAVFLGFAFKMPSVPFHTWLPDAHVEAPTPASMILAGLLLKMGGYGVIRIGAMMLPEALKALAYALAVFGVLSIIYGAFVCLAQVDIKRLIAYSSISHMGFVVLGIASLNILGINGAVFQMVSHGLISPLLFLMSGLLLEKAGSREIPMLGGMTKRFPVVGWVMIFASLASLGLPGLSGFIAELLVFLGAYQAYPLLTMGTAVVIVITAAYYIWMLQRAFFGPLNPRLEKYHEHVHWSESLSMAILIIFIVALGVYPVPLLDLISTTSADVVRLLGGA
ncbi:MAG: NADH-quinone oxidoreductase subunit M [Euryarchaeota archaeon]|nr:NADH-quinone oxidoreductase subunit M [Euryarchaeota archaeon]